MLCCAGLLGDSSKVREPGNGFAIFLNEEFVLPCFLVTVCRRNVTALPVPAPFPKYSSLLSELPVRMRKADGSDVLAYPLSRKIVPFGQIASSAIVLRAQVVTTVTLPGRRVIY